MNRNPEQRCNHLAHRKDPVDKILIGWNPAMKREEICDEGLAGLEKKKRVQANS